MLKVPFPCLMPNSFILSTIQGHQKHRMETCVSLLPCGIERAPQAWGLRRSPGSVIGAQIACQPSLHNLALVSGSAPHGNVAGGCPDLLGHRGLAVSDDVLF